MIELDAAVERNDVTILTGLPRVGRSSFLSNWTERRTDAIRCQRLEDVRLEPGFFILDHVDESEVDEIIRFVRAAAETKSRTRLVVAPNDLAGAERLREGLPGLAVQVEISPLRLEELVATVGQYDRATGPDQVAPLASVPAPAPAFDPNLHWLRGGFPDSLLAEDDQNSLLWRRRMLDGLLARDYTKRGVERAFPLIDLFVWLAKQNSYELDEDNSGFAKRKEFKSAVYVIERLGLVRRLHNYSGRINTTNPKQKLFIRDSGLLHALLEIETLTQLRASDAIGESFESYAIEALILATEGRSNAYFYREKGDNGEDEIDLILKFPSQGGRLVAIEIKVSPSQRAKRGFYKGCEALDIEERFVVHSGETAYLDESVQRLDLRSAISRIAKTSQYI